MEKVELKNGCYIHKEMLPWETGAKHLQIYEKKLNCVIISRIDVEL
jgi:hypothetical protein